MLGYGWGKKLYIEGLYFSSVHFIVHTMYEVTHLLLQCIEFMCTYMKILVLAVIWTQRGRVINHYVWLRSAARSTLSTSLESESLQSVYIVFEFFHNHSPIKSTRALSTAQNWLYRGTPLPPPTT